MVALGHASQHVRKSGGGGGGSYGCMLNLLPILATFVRDPIVRDPIAAAFNASSMDGGLTGGAPGGGDGGGDGRGDDSSCNFLMLSLDHSSKTIDFSVASALPIF